MLLDNLIDAKTSQPHTATSISMMSNIYTKNQYDSHWTLGTCSTSTNGMQGSTTRCRAAVTRASSQTRLA